jgi:PKD repeat protein
MKISIDPKGGIYNRPVYVNFKHDTGVTVWYTFDPLASHRWFTKYETQFLLPHGLSSIRYFAKSFSGLESEIFNTRFIVDTIPPKLNRKISSGHAYDTLTFNTREKTFIRFTRNNTLPVPESELYAGPLIIPRSGVQRLKARAWDEAGNVSEISEWEYKYDLAPPEVTILTRSAAFRAPFTVYVKVNEPAKIFYTTDNTVPGKDAYLYSNEGIPVTREDTTVLRVIAIDSAGNSSREYTERYYLDSKPPSVRVRIDGSLQTGNFLVSLLSNEPADIYYETSGATPATTSSRYTEAISMTTGQVLKYFAVDKSGNASTVGTMDELKRPMVEAVPRGGVYNKKLSISFKANSTGVVHWRILPDTTFTAAHDSVIMDKEGLHTFEYYLETPGGLRGTIHRQEYVIDWTPPEFEIRTRKGTEDSTIVFLRSSERASFYYTIDGSNPMTSSTAGTAGNRFLQNSDRLVFKRKPDLKLALYALDAAGNQSPLSVVDIFSPHAIPDVPAGIKRIYDKALSVSFNSLEGTVIHYTIDGSAPDQTAPIFTKPITLVSSDTIMAMVVDASGYQGPVDTFIYRVDLPPTALFTFSPDRVNEGDTVTFDASSSFDKESDPAKLRYRWDFNGDGVFDTDTVTQSRVRHRFERAGFYHVTLEVYDVMSRSGSVENVCVVKERCPNDMVSVVNENGLAFCIDIYEWPNVKGAVPQSGISWVEAKITCIDAGKRLCTAMEWEQACQGQSTLLYPYGDVYQEERCPVDAKKIQNSGKYSQCETSGAFDMLGNVWEWVEDKNGDYPFSYGGSFRYGKIARCSLKSEGNVSSQSNETGFRCCK